MTRFTLLTALSFLMYNGVVGQTRCDTISEGIIMYAEEMPKSNIPNNQLEEMLNSSINLKEYMIEDEAVIYINFIVNCHGDDFDYKVLKPVDEKLESEVLSVLQSNATWTAGKHHDKEVDVLQIMQIQIKNNEFRIVDEKGKRSKRR